MFTFATAVSQFYIRFHIVISFAASSPSWHLARLLLACAATKSCWNFLIERKGYCEEALGLFSDLINLDPSHKRYYEDERSLVIMDQVTWKMFEHFVQCKT
jgi:hypothetical protein